MTTRVSQACQRCQRRKLKCNGQPQCSSCRSSNQICKYGSANRKRGLAEGYVRGLERLMGFAIRRDSTLSSDIKQLLLMNQSKQPQSTSMEQETMLEVWKKSAVARDIDRLVPALERGEALQWQSVFASADNPVSHSCEQHTIGEYNMFGADVAQSHLTHPHVNLKLQDMDELSVRSGDPLSAMDGTISNKSVEDSERANGELQYMIGSLSGPNSPSSLPENAKQMIDEYFAYTNCWMPILEPHEVLRTFHQCRNPHTLDRTGIGDLGQLAVLWAIFAFESHKVSTSELAPPTNLHESPIYKFARSLIPGEEDDHNFGHVQALILLSMVNLGYGLFKSASFLVGSALRMILHIQIDDSQRNRSASRLLPHQNSRKPHIIAGCCILERLLALRLGHPVPIGTLPQRPILLEDGLDEWETPRFPYLPLDSSSRTEMDTPGHILSTFNGFSRTVEVLSEHFANSAQNVSIDMEKAKSEGILNALQSSSSELSEKYAQSRYPQFLLHYMMNLSAVLALRCYQTKAGQRFFDPSKEFFLLNSLMSLPSLIKEFENMYGASRVPVVLAIILHQIHEDMRFVIQILPAKDKTSIFRLFEALRQTVTEFSESWPAMREIGEPFEMSSTLSSENDSSIQVLDDAPTLHNDSEHLPLNEESMSWNNLRPFSEYRPEAKALPSITTAQSSGSQAENYGLANSGIKLAGNEISDNIPLPQGLAVDAADGVEDIYFQLAHPDITEWSGNWQQDGLRELGFDNNAFEQLYNGE